MIAFDGEEFLQPNVMVQFALQFAHLLQMHVLLVVRLGVEVLELIAELLALLERANGLLDQVHDQLSAGLQFADHLEPDAVEFGAESERGTCAFS